MVDWVVVDPRPPGRTVTTTTEGTTVGAFIHASTMIASPPREREGSGEARILTGMPLPMDETG